MTAETEKRYEKASNFTPDEKMLVTLRDELHEGSWEKFLTFLNAKEDARPYNDKLVKRAKEDIPRIEVLQRYELDNKVNLADLLKKKQSSEN